jgi:hypothetical protein
MDQAPALTEKDSEQLRLLGVFHYLVGGFEALFALFPVLHLIVGLGILGGSGPFGPERGPGAPPAFVGMVGLFFVAFSGFWILVGMTLGLCTVIAGSRLRQMRARQFCTVVAACNCLVMPFGTVLGVLTLLVLNRDGVRHAFDLGTEAAWPAG